KAKPRKKKPKLKAKPPKKKPKLKAKLKLKRPKKKPKPRGRKRRKNRSLRPAKPKAAERRSPKAGPRRRPSISPHHPANSPSTRPPSAQRPAKSRSTSRTHRHSNTTWQSRRGARNWPNPKRLRVGRHRSASISARGPTPSSARCPDMRKPAWKAPSPFDSRLLLAPPVP